MEVTARTETAIDRMMDAKVCAESSTACMSAVTTRAMTAATFQVSVIQATENPHQLMNLEIQYLQFIPYLPSLHVLSI